MKKKVKISATIILILLLAFSITGCGENRDAKATVKNMFEAFQSLNFEEAEKYIDVDEIKFTTLTGGFLGNSRMFMKNVFDKLEYDIISCIKRSDDIVYVTTKITAIDMRPIIRDFSNATLYYDYPDDWSTEDYNKKFEELLIETISKKTKLATTTSDVMIKVVKQDGEWRIVLNDALTEAFWGGLTEENRLDAMYGE